MSLIHKRWFRFLLVFILLSIGWIISNIAYITTDLNKIKDLSFTYSRLIGLVCFIAVCISVAWSLEHYKLSIFRKFFISLFLAIGLWILCGLIALITVVLLGFSI